MERGSPAHSAPAAARRPGRPRRERGADSEVQALSRALALLEHLARTEQGETLSALARRAGLAASTAHRLLNTLAAHGFAAQDGQSGRWQVGIRAFAVGNAFLGTHDFVRAARPFMEQLMEAAGESVNLAVLDEGDAVFVAQVECRQMMRMLARPGSRAPAHASAVGKALLATLGESALEHLLGNEPLARYTPSSILGHAALRADLQRARDLGYAVDDEEHAVGLRCLAATIHDHRAAALAALSVSGPRARIDEARMARLGELVRDAADRLTSALGGRLPEWRQPQMSHVLP